MQEALLVGRQVVLIFIYVMIGAICTKKGVLTQESGKSLSNFSLTIITPVLLVRHYMRPLESQYLKGLGLAFFLCILFHIVATLISMVVIPKREDIRYRIERFGVVYSNCAYMAIPLIRVIVGDIGVFYSLAYISVFNLFLWSLGILTLVGKESVSWKKMLFNPGMLAFAAGTAVYLLQIQFPPILLEAMDNIIVFNTPLPMITCGIFLSGIHFKKTLTNVRLYYNAAIRLLVLPLLMLAMIWALGVASWFPEAPAVIWTVVLGCACPAAAAVTLLSARHGLDGEYGAQLMAVSTLLSILTLPLIALLCKMLLQ